MDAVAEAEADWRSEWRSELLGQQPASKHAATSKFGGGWMAVQPEDEQGRPFALCVLAGGCASATVDVTIHPLDTLKTRLQAPNGFAAAGGYRGLFRGVVPAALGAIPGGAVFFGTYEYTKFLITPGASGNNEAVTHWLYDAVSATTAAMASCLIRNPAAVLTQRLQVGQFASLFTAARSIGANGLSAFYRGLGASVARELPFAFIQFPLYESLKRLVAPIAGISLSDVTPTQGALCGSLSGAVAAAVTTPFDTLKTRQMLGTELGLFALSRQIVQKEGWLVLFSGMGPRVGWMTVGGCIFFGVYEKCMLVLTQLYRTAQQEELQLDHAPSNRSVLQTLQHGLKKRATKDNSPLLLDCEPLEFSCSSNVIPPVPQAGASEKVPAMVALLSGGLAGMMIDCVLFPDIDLGHDVKMKPTITSFLNQAIARSAEIAYRRTHQPLSTRQVDTLKTRAIHGIGFNSKDVLSLWNGLGAALLPAVPAAAAFFFTYEGIKAEAARLLPGGGGVCVPFVAAALAEGVSCIVRVPAELLKMKLQVNRDATLIAVFSSTWSHGGVRALYKGLGATLMLDLPFAMIQLPLFESLKNVALRWRHSRPCEPGRVGPMDGAAAGGIAGALAALVTTPMDVIRTRHVLKPQAIGGDGSSFVTTARLIYKTTGLRGFWVGVVPRTGYMFLGGVVYLGTYNYCCCTISRLGGFQ